MVGTIYATRSIRKTRVPNMYFALRSRRLCVKPQMAADSSDPSHGGQRGGLTAARKKSSQKEPVPGGQRT